MQNSYCYKHNPIVRKIFLTMLVPTILMNLTTAIGSMADTIIIGQYLDDQALSVVTFATPIYMIINTFAALFAVGGCIAMSIDAGKGEKETANQAFSLSIELLAITGIVLLGAGLFMSRLIAGWLGAGADVFELVREYAQIVLLGGPIFVLNIGVAFFVRNDGRPTLSMVGMFTSIVVDIILNFVFVGYMGMGVSGAAYSTVLGQLVSLVIIGSHFLSSKNTLKFRFTWNNMVYRIVKNGGSTALHFVYQFLTVLIINHFLAKMAGTNGVVIYTVVFNLSTVSLSVFEGISQTIQPMISNYFGEKSYKNINETMRLAIVTVFIICGTVTVLLEAVPQVVPTMFGIEDALLVQQSAVAVRIFATSMIITTVNVVIGYYLQSTEKNAMASTLISLRCFVLFMLFTLTLGKMFGINGVWAAYTCAEVVTFIICIFMVRGKQKQLKKEGIASSMLLLDQAIENSIECFTYNAHGNDFSVYEESVMDEVQKLEEIVPDMKAYIEQLSLCAENKKDYYVEVEINKKEEKIIVRDNLDHSKLKENMQSYINHGSKSDYGPVLGWNRLCLERGER